jgi:hypothetical protein
LAGGLDFPTILIAVLITTVRKKQNWKNSPSFHTLLIAVVYEQLTSAGDRM